MANVQPEEQPATSQEAEQAPQAPPTATDHGYAWLARSYFSGFDALTAMWLIGFFLFFIFAL